MKIFKGILELFRAAAADLQGRTEELEGKTLFNNELEYYVINDMLRKFYRRDS